MRVVHCKKEPYDVYIGKPSKWGNPFMVGRDGDRATVLALFREYIQKNTVLLQDIGELRGKTLGCWCHPLPCHGDILEELANK